MSRPRGRSARARARRAGPLRLTPSLRWWLAYLTVGAAVWLRAPTWNDHILFIDEPIYFSFAARLELPGAHVYTHTADQKPPLGPLTYWLAIKVDPQHAITVIHIFTTVAIAVTALLLLASSQMLLGCPWPGFGAGLLYALISASAPTAGEPFFAFSSLEHFQAPLLIGFLLLFLLSLRRRRWWDAVAAGVLLGTAAMYKPNVLVLLGPAWFVGAAAARRGRLPLSCACLLTAVATGVTLALVAVVPLYYAVIGHFAAWRLYNIEALLLYRGLAKSLVQQTTLLAAQVPLKGLLLAGVLYGALVAPRLARSSWVGELGALLAASWLALFLSLTPGLHKAHYLIQALPAQCLLIGILVCSAWSFTTRAPRSRRPIFGLLFLTLLALPLAFATHHLTVGRSALSKYVAGDTYLDLHRRRGTLVSLVNYIDGHSRPDDLIYVHSEAPELYLLAQRRPAVSDPTGSWIAMAPSDQMADVLLANLQATPPQLIIQLDYRRYGRVRQTLQRWPQLCSWIYQHYRERTYIDHVQILEWQGPSGRPDPAATMGREVFLSSLAPETAVQSAGWLRFDRNLWGHALRIGTHTYAHGIGTHAPSRLSYRLDGQYRWFAALIGIDAAVGNKGSAVFTVAVDGVQRLISPIVRGGEPPRPIRVSVSGARTLALAVAPAGRTAVPDWADWAQARLLRASATTAAVADPSAPGSDSP